MGCFYWFLFIYISILAFSRFSWVIYFIHIFVYMWVPISQFIPPSFPRLLSIRLFSTSVSLFLLCFDRQFQSPEHLVSTGQPSPSSWSIPKRAWPLAVEWFMDHDTSFPRWSQELKFCNSLGPEKKIPLSWTWRGTWQPSPAFFSGESHGLRRLAGYSP